MKIFLEDKLSSDRINRCLGYEISGIRAYVIIFIFKMIKPFIWDYNFTYPSDYWCGSANNTVLDRTICCYLAFLYNIIRYLLRNNINCDCIYKIDKIDNSSDWIMIDVTEKTREEIEQRELFYSSIKRG